MNNLAMREELLHRIDAFYNRVEQFWSSRKTWKFVVTLIILIFLIYMVLITFKRFHWFSGPLTHWIPTNHFYAVHLAFSMLLIIEVMGLVFSIAHSIARSVGKQFEIFSLILLRQSFEEFVNFSEPIVWEEVRESIVHIVSNAAGSLLIFLALGVYYRIQKHRRITSDDMEQFRFIATKKVVALVLLFIFIVMGIHHTYTIFHPEHTYFFFNSFYTVLIFSDILLVLISLRYCSTYHVVYRDSGFALGTVLIRIALTAPPVYNVLLGIGASALIIALTLIYNMFIPEIEKEALFKFK